MSSQRIQRKRTKGFKLPPNTICVNRPTKWGNDFIVGKELTTRQKAFVAIRFGKTPEGVEKMETSGELSEKITLKKALKYYKAYIEKKIKNKILNIEDLRGKNLACFCPLSQPCHVDILLKLANK